MHGPPQPSDLFRRGPRLVAVSNRLGGVVFDLRQTANHETVQGFRGRVLHVSFDPVCADGNSNSVACFIPAASLNCTSAETPGQNSSGPARASGRSDVLGAGASGDLPGNGPRAGFGGTTSTERRC